jgi:hypothetical protein
MALAARPLPTQLMAGLALLKHLYDLSDEALCNRRLYAKTKIETAKRHQALGFQRHGDPCRRGRARVRRIAFLTNTIT